MAKEIGRRITADAAGKIVLVSAVEGQWTDACILLRGITGKGTSQKRQKPADNRFDMLPFSKIQESMIAVPERPVAGNEAYQNAAARKKNSVLKMLTLLL